MGYWGWRPLIFGLFISTWVAGCNMVADSASPSLSPSAYPQVTLTVGTLPAARVSAAPTRAAPTALILETVHPGSTSAPDTDNTLLVQPPTCYETHPGSLLCLGRVDNALDHAVEAVTVEVRLLHADGTVYLRQVSAVEQTIIPAGSSAPYQAIFEANARDFAAVNARLVSARDTPTPLFIAMRIENVTTEIIGGRVLITAVIVNPTAQTVEVVRTFVTLSDHLGRVIGYRVFDFGTGTLLDPDGHLPLHIELMPQTADSAPEYTFYVEALDTGQ